MKKEQRFLEKRQQKKETALNRLLSEKVPEKLQHTLDTAFEKAFYLIFEKGTGIIEKTYPKEKLKKEFKVNLYADQVYGTRKTLRVFGKKSRTFRSQESGGFRDWRGGNGDSRHRPSGHSGVYGNASEMCI